MNAKYFLSVTFALGCFFAGAQGKITINSDAPNDTLYYKSVSVADVATGNYDGERDTLMLKNGTGIIHAPAAATFYTFGGPAFGNKGVGDIIVTPGDDILITSITGAPLKVTGTPLAESMLDYNVRRDAVQEQIRNSPKAAFDSLYNAWIAIPDKMLPQHLDDEFGVFLLSEARIDARNKYIDSIAPAIRTSFMAPLYDKARKGVDSYREFLAAKERIKVGAKGPDFTLPDLQGKQISLSSFAGKWVLLDFWGSWCHWCIKGIPQMKEMYARYKDKCEFVGIDCGDSKEDWQQCVAEHQLAWPQLINDAEGSRSVSAIYAVRGYPTKILLNPEGVIAKICVGEDPDFYSDFDQLFK